jgi:enterochelin esterase-like enzyme
VEAAAPIALVGLSMGGFGALRLGAFAGSGRVAAAAGLSSITHLDQMPLFGADLSEAGVTPGQESVLDAILAGRGRLPRLHIDCGRDDLLIEHNRELHRALSDEAVDHQWVEHEGGHDWTYWQTHLPAALRFASGALSDRA